MQQQQARAATREALRRTLAGHAPDDRGDGTRERGRDHEVRREGAHGGEVGRAGRVGEEAGPGEPEVTQQLSHLP